jgi:hypothetical protein
MTAESSASSLAFTSRLAHYFGAIADSLEWDHSSWVGLCSQLQLVRRNPGELTLSEIQLMLTERSRLGAVQ